MEGRVERPMGIRQENDQKYFYQFDGCAIVAIDGVRQKKESIASRQANKIEFAAVTVTARLFSVL